MVSDSSWAKAAMTVKKNLPWLVVVSMFSK